MNTLTKGFAKRALSMLLVTIMVFSLGIVGLTSASAANVELAETGDNTVSGGHIYFDKPTSWGSTCVQFVIGHDTYSRTYVMSKVSNSNMYYINISALDNHTWEDATYYAFINSSSKWGDGGWGSSNLSNATNRTAAYTSEYNLNDGSTYVFTPANSSNGATLSIEPGTSFTTANTTNYVYAKSTTDGTNFVSDATAGIVSISGYYLNGDNSVATRSAVSSTTSSHYKSTTLVQGSTATVTATPSTGYKFVGWYSAAASGGTCYSTETTYSYTVGKSTTYMYARFETEITVEITSATASVGVEAVVGDPSTINVSYDVSGSESTPTFELLLNGATYSGDYSVDYTTNTISVAPAVADKYSFSVKITIDGVSATTNAVELTVRDAFSASLSADTKSIYVGDGSFTLTVDDNSDQYSTATYTLKKADGTVVEDGNTTGVFTIPADAVGEETYYVTVTMTGAFNMTKDTNTVTLTVKEKVFSVTLDAPASTMEDHDFTVTANVMFAPEGDIEYTLAGSDGKTFTSTDGVFTVVSNDPADVTYTVTVTVTAAEGAVYTATDTVTVTITEDSGTYPVKIFFKCSDTYGYLPNAKVDGTPVELEKSTAIITANASDTACYYWYSYTSDTNVEFGQDIVFAVNANRNYFYNVSYTVSAGEGDYVYSDGYYYYYLAIENLNGGTNTLTNISSLTEEQRNWTESAVNMIYNEVDAIATVAVNYSYANYGDANCDGNINIKDATYIQKSLAKVVEASTLSTIVSDVNQDGSVTIKDATAIQKQLANL